MSEDLVRAKLVTSMRRPEGNTTGVSIMGTELDAKRLEILAKMLPSAAPSCSSRTSRTRARIEV